MYSYLNIIDLSCNTRINKEKSLEKYLIETLHWEGIFFFQIFILRDFVFHGIQP